MRDDHALTLVARKLRDLVDPAEAHGFHGVDETGMFAGDGVGFLEIKTRFRCAGTVGQHAIVGRGGNAYLRGNVLHGVGILRAHAQHQRFLLRNHRRRRWRRNDFSPRFIDVETTLATRSVGGEIECVGIERAAEKDVIIF